MKKLKSGAFTTTLELEPGREYEFRYLLDKKVCDENAIEEACGPGTRMIYVESPSNPLLTIVDLAAVAAFAKPRGIMTIIDNTFASPILQNPLVLGFDLVMHSGTKYLGGHSDLCCGTVNGSAELIAKVRDHAIAYGGCLNAQDCYLLERSLKTLALRVERQSSNAAIIAGYLDENEHVKRVYYPGLINHPGFEEASRQMRGFGGMVTVELKGGHEAAKRFVQSLRIFTSAVSLGGVESLAEIPYFLTHSAMQETEVAIDPATVRLSVGLEHAHDLIADLDQALAQIQ